MTDYEIEKALDIIAWLLHQKNITEKQQKKLYELTQIIQGD